MKSVAEKMTPADKEKVKEAIEANAAKLDEQCARLAWVPGAEEKVKPAVEEVLEKMGALVGTKPQTRVTNVAAELAQTFGKLTEAMGRVKDATTAARRCRSSRASRASSTRRRRPWTSCPRRARPRSPRWSSRSWSSARRSRRCSPRTASARRSSRPWTPSWPS
ncbi:MAG: hypothetical protein U0797_06665 [Gemmataceae bacterium]